jgi:uncharacterized membrane protein
MRNNDDKVIGRLRILGWSLVAILLLLPAIAMQFTDEVNWTASDFLFAAVLLIGTGMVCELIVRRSKNNAYRMAAVLALAAAFLLTWSNAAVGFIGSGGNLPNVLYFIMPLIGFIAGIAVRFKPKGMATTMAALAIFQGLVTILAFATGLVRTEETFTILGINAFFITLWTGAAMLFRQSMDKIA